MSEPTRTRRAGVIEAFERIRAGRPIRVYNGTRGVRVCSAAEIHDKADGLTIVEAAGHSIGIVRINGRLYAIRNECPHNGAPLCRGTRLGTYPPTHAHGFEASEMDGRILACPWHGRQFDIVTGQAVYQPEVSVLTYEVWEDDSGVFVRV